VRTDNDWDMHGKTILVTGGSGGIGLATARSLGRRGARIIITGRNQRRGEDAAAAIEAETGQTGSVTFMAADHSKVGGNQQLASQVWAQFGGMDVLINNVGGLYERRWETADGYEATLAMNFVGPFALTSELVPLLRANAPSRCVVVTSAALKMRKEDAFDDVHSTTVPFVGSDACARAKLLNLLFGLSLATRLAATALRTRPHNASPFSPTPANTSNARTSPNASRPANSTPRRSNAPGSSVPSSSPTRRHDMPLSLEAAHHGYLACRTSATARRHDALDRPDRSARN
jgi:NAD(P)-dependent dehydrogenase (short-subunit alcohol dehydrogenase family)